MTNLYEKLHTESEYIRLTDDERQKMRAAIFGMPAQDVPLRPAMPARSPYLFMLSRRWAMAVGALLIVVFVGGGTAYASEDSLPGQPLYAIKVGVIEPVQLAMAATPADKAAVHVAIAQTRVAEAEALAEEGKLDAAKSSALAANFETHAQNAVLFANAAAETDPAVSAEIKAQLAASSAVGGAVLSVLGSEDHGQGNGNNQQEVNAIAARVLAVANSDESNRGPARSAAVRTFAPAPQGEVRTMATMTATSAKTNAAINATNTSGPGQQSDTGSAEVGTLAAVNPQQQKAAAELQGKAEDVLASLRAQLAAASSTLDASTTASIQTTLAGIDGLMQDGARAMTDSTFDTAVSDYTQVLSRTLRLSGLLEAQQKFNRNLIDPIIQSDSGPGADSNSNQNSNGANTDVGPGPGNAAPDSNSSSNEALPPVDLNL